MIEAGAAMVTVLRDEAPPLHILGKPTSQLVGIGQPRVLGYAIPALPTGIPTARS